MSIEGKIVALGFIWLSTLSHAQGAPSLDCRPNGRRNANIQVRSTNEGITLNGVFTDQHGKNITLDRCQGQLIGFGQVPDFGDKVETFWLDKASGCASEFMQLDDSVYSALYGPMRLSCNQTECTTESFVCSKRAARPD